MIFLVTLLMLRTLRIIYLKKVNERPTYFWNAEHWGALFDLRHKKGAHVAQKLLGRYTTQTDAQLVA